VGIAMFPLFTAIAFIANKFSEKLNKIDKTVSSYQYLLSFDNWVKEMISVNTKLSRYLYAYVFIAMVSGLVWKY
jgi:hypothetical protein